MCPVLGSSVRERQGATGEGLVEGHKDDCGSGASLLQGKIAGAGPVYSREERTERGSH